ncbi:MAG: hypothetical protein J6Z34_01800 [Clostridia bacterium]|nr:hypothetical protein [Clostridia bacterium]
MKTVIRNYLTRIKEVSSGDKGKRLPDNCFFIGDSEVACLERSVGDSRYPYSADGFTMWAHSSGYISVNESTFYVILPSANGKEPFVTAFGGIKNGEEFQPVSVTPIMALPGEKGCFRATVFTPQAVYYIAETDSAVFALRAFVTKSKEVCFTLFAENTGKKEKEMYLSPYINCLLKQDTAECIETNWFKECRFTETGYIFTSVEDLDRTTHLEHFCTVTRSVKANAAVTEKTTARTEYTGGTNVPIMCSPALRSAKTFGHKPNTRFTDTPVLAECVRFRLLSGETASVSYKLTCSENREKAERLSLVPLAENEFEDYLSEAEKSFAVKNAEMTDMYFGKMEGKIDNEVFNLFLKSVQRQTEFAALAKNSGVSLLGVRDVFQQIEAALMWNPSGCRAKIVEALGFIGKDGRPPRQYSMPPAEGKIPRMDLRPFIDQGVWIIDAVYSYLAFTGDYGILGEVCGYYEFRGNEVLACDEKDSVLDHLLRITDYMAGKLDFGKTDCLRAMFGDWNDALDGLGVSADGSKEYGTGVSVMASLQFYRNLGAINEILSVTGGSVEKMKKYAETREKLAAGLSKYAVVTDGKNKKILHGWGDDYSYSVGGFSDPDGASRDGLTANAFWIISDFILKDGSVRNAILQSFARLDGKYGLKTFEPYFPVGMKGVGRIVNLPRGTAENAATYVHATLFGIWALFRMGEDEFAWRQLEKILPITHDHMSTTPFVMSNSYSYNEEYGMDGESMSDWFTGSANVLIKVMVRCVFGVNADLGGVTVSPARQISKGSRIRIKVKNAELTVINKSEGLPEKFFVCGKERESFTDPVSNRRAVYLSNDELKGNIVIETE